MNSEACVYCFRFPARFEGLCARCRERISDISKFKKCICCGMKYKTTARYSVCTDCKSGRYMEDCYEMPDVNYSVPFAGFSSNFKTQKVLGHCESSVDNGHAKWGLLNRYLPSKARRAWEPNFMRDST